MKTKILIILFLSSILFISCEENTVMSALKDGEELMEGDLVPFLLGQNYPNPFNPTTSITYQVAVELRLTMKIYSEDWVEIATIVDRVHLPGYYKVDFNAINSAGEILPSGDYYYCLEGGGVKLTRKTRLMK